MAGHEVGKRPEDKAQLAHPLKVKEMNGGMGVPIWSKRFTVLCGSRMFIFPGSRPKGKPNLVLDLRGGRIEEHKSKKHFYCLKVTASHREVRLAFETGLEQSTWLERAAKVNKEIGNFFSVPFDGCVINLSHEIKQDWDLS